MEAERRLKEAEKSLHKLGIAVENETPNIESGVKEQMVVNVNKLKGRQNFFPKFDFSRCIGVVNIVLVSLVVHVL